MKMMSLLNLNPRRIRKIKRSTTTKGLRSEL
jgi:hypothetical protein